jgi:hypothetical protein
LWTYSDLLELEAVLFVFYYKIIKNINGFRKQGGV